MSRNVPAKIYADKSAIPINSRLMIFVVYWPILGPVATKITKNIDDNIIIMK